MRRGVIPSDDLRVRGANHMAWQRKARNPRALRQVPPLTLLGSVLITAPSYGTRTRLVHEFQQPDLVITTSLSVTPTTVSAGSAVTLSKWTVRNAGVRGVGSFRN